jgi:hypothetical protein
VANRHNFLQGAAHGSAIAGEVRQDGHRRRFGAGEQAVPLIIWALHQIIIEALDPIIRVQYKVFFIQQIIE